MQQLKRLWPIPAVLMLVLLALKTCAEMVPFNIEPERVRPQAKIELPKIQMTSDSVDYFFEPSAAERIKPGDPYPVVHMRIPKAPYFDRQSSSGPTREYDLYITMFYPNFSGLADPENAECGEDAKIAAGRLGYCRREMTVGFGLSLNLPNTTQYAQYEKLQSDIAQGFVEPAFEKSKFNDLKLVGVQGKGENKTTYYVGKDESGRLAYVFRCSEDVPSPACDTRFRATKSPYIFIKLNFVLALLPQWKEVITATRSKVDGMIVQTYQLKQGE
jgi:hypothetical protein